MAVTDAYYIKLSLFHRTDKNDPRTDQHRIRNHTKTQRRFSSEKHKDCFHNWIQKIKKLTVTFCLRILTFSCKRMNDAFI